MGKEHIRVSDADREQVVDRLRNAMGEGRLTLPEFDERLQHVYAAKTFGELQPVLHDLPVQRGSSAPSRGVGPFPTWVAIMWTPWVFVNLLCILIWVATGAGYFWPFWVEVPWGLALCIPSAIGMLTQRR